MAALAEPMIPVHFQEKIGSHFFRKAPTAICRLEEMQNELDNRRSPTRDPRKFCCITPQERLFKPCSVFFTITQQMEQQPIGSGNAFCPSTWPLRQPHRFRMTPTPYQGRPCLAGHRGFEGVKGRRIAWKSFSIVWSQSIEGSKV